MQSVGRAFGIVTAGAIACAVPSVSGQQSVERLMGTVLFAADSDTVTPAGAKILDSIAAKFKDPETPFIIVRGHSEPREHAQYGPQYGRGLSQRRASNVRSYLEARGVKPNSLVTEAFGVSKPIKGVEPAKLRRVEVVFSAGNGW